MPEQQTLTAQQKLNLLFLAGVKPTIMPDSGLSHEAYPRGLCECCGVVDVPLAISAYSTKETVVANYQKKIYMTRTGPAVDIPDAILPCAIIIPDVTGNLLLEWNDL